MKLVYYACKTNLKIEFSFHKYHIYRSLTTLHDILTAQTDNEPQLHD